MLTLCPAHIATIRAELDKRNLTKFNKMDGQDRERIDVPTEALGKNRPDPLTVVQEKILKIGVRQLPLQSISRITYCPCCEARKKFDEAWEDDPGVLVPWDTELIVTATENLHAAMRKEGYV